MFLIKNIKKLNRLITNITGIVKKPFIAIFVLAALLFPATGCSLIYQDSGFNVQGEKTGSSSQNIQKAQFDGEILVITGSTTMLEVTNMWAEAFMSTNGSEVTVNGGGSGEGINSLLNGSTDLANSSREIQDKEKQIAWDNGRDIREYTVLMDGLAIIVSKNVMIEQISIEQLSAIFRGQITNWKELGGNDRPIVAAARDSTSGTGEYFLQEVVRLGDKNSDSEYTDMCLLLQSTAEVVNVVGGNDDAIGFIGLGYLKIAGDNIKPVKVTKYLSGQGVAATVETVRDKSYPLSRGLYIYADLKKFSPLSSAYIDFVYSKQGQDAGIEAGFVPVK